MANQSAESGENNPSLFRLSFPIIETTVASETILPIPCIGEEVELREILYSVKNVRRKFYYASNIAGYESEEEWLVHEAIVFLEPVLS